MGTQRYIKISLFLFGGLMFGYNAAVYLHELSHALVMLWLGGSVDHIEMNPFAVSYTYYASASPNPILTNWAGLILAPLFALSIFGFCILLKRDYPVLLGMMIVIGSLANNGAYAILDTYLTHYGDPADLLDLGVPKAQIVGLGILLLSALLLLTSSLGATLGFQTDDGILKRFIFLGGGVITYFSLYIFYEFLFPQNKSEAGGYAVPLAAVLAFAVATISRFIQPIVKLKIAKPVTEMSWGLVFFTLFLGIAFITVEFLFI